MNEQEHKVVAETNRLEEETGDRIVGIEKQLEDSTQVASSTAAELRKNTARLEKAQHAADGVLASTKTTNMLLNRLRRWGARSHVGRYRDSKPTQKKSEAMGSASLRGSRIEELLHELDVDSNILKEGVQEQRARACNMENYIASDMATVQTARKNAANSRKRINSLEENTTAQDEAFDRIGKLLDGLHNQAKEFTSILNSQKNSLDALEGTMESAHSSIQRVNRRLRT